MRKWPFYILLFLALWGINFAVSVVYRLPAVEVRRMLLRDALAPALTALFLGLIHGLRNEK